VDTKQSKALWLGRYLFLIGWVKTVGSGSEKKDDRCKELKRYAESLAKSLNLNVDLETISGDASGISFARENVRQDVAIIQSEFVAKCFLFGYDFSVWFSNADSSKGSSSEVDIGLLAKVEEILRKQANELGLGAILEKCIAAAKDSAFSRESFGEFAGSDMLLEMTAKLDQLGPARVGTSTQSKQLFIVMRMTKDDPTLEDRLDAIGRTAISLGLTAYRVDQLETSGRITDSIVNALKSAQFVVVDLTHSRPNVYWEAGFTHGLGKIPIYIAETGTDLEFDIKDYPIIYYRNNKELAEGLGRRLRGQML
jgi:hypothetical protein